MVFSGAVLNDAHRGLGVAQVLGDVLAGTGVLPDVDLDELHALLAMTFLVILQRQLGPWRRR